MIQNEEPAAPCPPGALAARRDGVPLAEGCGFVSIRLVINADDLSVSTRGSTKASSRRTPKVW
jgi:hypothetical protein